MARCIVDWNGKDLPRELRELPVGRYIVEEYDDELEEISEEQDAELREAIASITAGHSRPASAVHRRLRSIVSKRVSKRR